MGGGGGGGSGPLVYDYVLLRLQALSGSSATQAKVNMFSLQLLYLTVTI